MTRKIAILIALMVTALAASAQNELLLNHYWAAPTLYNPASAGGVDAVRILGGGRLQWMGMEDHPKEYVGAVDAPFKLFGQKFGAGVTGVSINQGLYRGLDAAASIAYRVKLGPGELAAAVRIGYLSMKFKGSDYVAEGDSLVTDEMPTTDVKGHAIDLGAGVEYSLKFLKVGVSLLHATQPTITMRDGNIADNLAPDETDEEGNPTEEEKFTFSPRRTLYFTAEGNIPISNTLFDLAPSAIVRTDFYHTDFIVTARARWKKMISAGVGYRHKDAVSFMVMGEVSGFFAGYSYDLCISGPGKRPASKGSHELIVGYNLKLDFTPKNRYKHKSIRIM